VLLPDSNSLLSSYDTGGNLTSLTPPGKSAHGFSYQAGGLESDYTPPAVDGSDTGHVHTDYDLDRQVSRVARAHTYLPTGEALRIVQNPSADNPYGVAGVEYRYGALGRQVAKTNFERQFVASTWTTTRPQGATYVFDESPTALSFTAGRLAAESSWEGSPDAIVTTITFGYDADGNTVRTDQVFPSGPTGTHSLLATYGNDGLDGARRLAARGWAAARRRTSGGSSAATPKLDCADVAAVERAGGTTRPTSTDRSPRAYDRDTRPP
jgi:hypothetical protein